MARAGGMDTMDPSRGQPDAGRLRRAGARLFRRGRGHRRQFLARPDGPRIGALAFNGWDTHVDEGAVSGRLATLLGALDGAIAAVETGMGAAWSETVVAVITEFGRTARINGTDGTDHGTAHRRACSPAARSRAAA